jgi:GxxExxY protein
MEGQAYYTLTDQVIGSSIEVHRKLGPGLLESAYRECLAREFLIRNISFEREVPVPVVYKGVHLECGYRLDFLIAERPVVEVKSVEMLAKVHEAQLITYLSLGGWQVGLLINFNEFLLKDGIRRKVFNYSE